MSVASGPPVTCDGCTRLIFEATEDHRVDGEWCCSECAFRALHGLGPFAGRYPESRGETA